MIHFGIRTKLKKWKESFQAKKRIYKHNLTYYMPKKYAHQKLFKTLFNKELNLKNPTDFNEKLQYLLVYHLGKKEGRLSDKLQVKEYVKNKKIHGLFIPNTLKKYKSVEEIDITQLPNQFVLKCNHGSGGVVICTDKKTFSLKEHMNDLNNTLHENFAKKMYEYQYQYIKPCVFAEEYLEDSEHHKNPLDYKIYCTNGKAKSILVCSERDTGLKLSEYDLNWNKIDCITDEYKQKKEIPKPKKLKEIIRIAEELTKDMPFVRVDLYEIQGKIYFGEYTFSPAAGVCGYYTPEGMKLHGDYIDLDLYTKNKKSR